MALITLYIVRIICYNTPRVLLSSVAEDKAVQQSVCIEMHTACGFVDNFVSSVSSCLALLKSMTPMQFQPHSYLGRS